jgi:ParB-like nuclease family protein
VATPTAIDVFALPVHPAADVFPMLSDEELDDLAEDIKANGLIQPLVIAAVDNEWTLVDGRNRREACRIAGVQPHVQDLNGTDPLSYIISSNIHRRHMNKGQQAMAMAMIYPEPQQGKRTDLLNKSTSAKLAFDKASLSRARAVLRHSPELAHQVLGGRFSLNDAFADVEKRSEDDKAKADVIERINLEYPDLVRQHASGEITDDQFKRLVASHEADKRKAVERFASQRRSTFEALQRAVSGARAFAIGTADAELLTWLDAKDFRNEFAGYFPDINVLRADAENVREGARRVLALVDAILDKESK